MKISEDFIKVGDGKQCSVIPIGETSRHTSGVFRLNESAEKIYDLIEEGKSTDGIVEALSNEYTSDKTEIKDFVDKFIGKLREAGIVVDE